jgi:hypothetical protein
MIVAVTALVVALAGTAVAATKLTKREKRQVRAIATRATQQLAPGLSVARAQTAGNADQAQSAQSAQSAQDAQSAINAQQAQNAATAGDASTLGGQPSSAFLPTGAVLRIPPTQISNSQTVNPIDLPDVDLFVSCGIDQTGQDVIDTEVAFTGTGSVIYGGLFDDVGSAADEFPTLQRAHPAPPSIDQQTVTIVADGGPSLTGVIWNGFNLGGATDRCFIGGHLVVSS